MDRKVWASAMAAVLATILIFAGAVVMLRSSDNAASKANPAAVTVTNTSGEQRPVDNADGERANGESQQAAAGSRPACPATSIGGVELPCLGSADGGGSAATPATDQITVASVWAWWCGPCREELPALQEFADAHPEFTVVGVHADRNAANGAAFLTDIGVDLPSYQDGSNAFAGALGLPAVVPITVVFRGERQIATFARPFTDAREIADAVNGAVKEES